MKKFILLPILVVALALLPFTVKGTPTLPLKTTIDRSGQWIQNATESSFFEWGGALYYIYTDRDLSGSTKQMKVVRFSDGAVIATFGSGYGCQDALVDSGTLYVFATGCWMDYGHQQNSIVKFTSTDLTTWSSPSTIYTPEATAQLYNVGVTKDGSNWLISYDVHNVNWYTDYFVSRFLTSTNGTSWTDVGSSNVLRGYGAVDPHIIGGTYYLFANQSDTIHQTKLFSTTNFSTYTKSRLSVLKPTFEYEDINTTDVDLYEFGGKTYIMYMTGDQTTYVRMTYATYDGTIAQLIDIYMR